MESAEHWHVGDAITLTLPDGSAQSADEVPLALSSASLSYGQVVALGGDFYGAPGLAPIATAADPEATFEAAFATLDTAEPDEVAAIIHVMGAERAAVEASLEAGDPASLAFEQLGNTLSYRWNEITGGARATRGDAGLAMNPGRYMKLATVNLDHFANEAVTAYVAGHRSAMTVAARARGLPGREADLALRGAYARNAFADHFLTDLFAAGHVRTPRHQLFQMSLSPRGESGFVAKCMHDEDNHRGLTVTNARGDRWTAFGDGMELDEVNAVNLRHAIAATQASADEVHQAFRQGSPVTGPPAALQFVPREVALSADPPRVDNGPNSAPLFWADPKAYVYRRGGLRPSGWRNTENYDYTRTWSSKAMCLEIYSGFDAWTPTGFR